MVQAHSQKAQQETKAQSTINTGEDGGVRPSWIPS